MKLFINLLALGRRSLLCRLLLLALVHTKILLQFLLHFSHLHLLFHFLLGCISLSSIFVHLVLQLFCVLIVHPVFFPQLLHHGRRLLVALFSRLLLLDPILVADILTRLFPLVFLFDMLLLSLILCFFLSNLSLLFLLQFFLAWRNLSGSS